MALDGEILLNQDIPTLTVVDAYNKLLEVKFVLSMVRRTMELANQDNEQQLDGVVDDLVTCGIRVDKAMRVLKRRYFSEVPAT